MARALPLSRLNALPGMRACEIHETKGKDHVRYTGIRVLWWPSIVTLLQHHKDQACTLALTDTKTWRLQFMPVAYARKDPCPQSLDQWLVQQTARVQHDSQQQRRAKRRHGTTQNRTTVRRTVAEIDADCSILLSDLQWVPERVCSLAVCTLGSSLAMTLVTRWPEAPGSERSDAETPPAKKPRVMRLPKTSQFARVPIIE